MYGGCNWCCGGKDGIPRAYCHGLVGWPALAPTGLTVIYLISATLISSLVCCVKHNVNNFSMVMINSSAETLTCNTQLHTRLGAIFVQYIVVMKVT